LDENIKRLLQELGDTINSIVTQSPRVEAIMDAIRESGYEVYLMLEANIAVEHTTGRLRDGLQSDEKFTEDDRRFLKRLRIDG
jgi:hypothetical protein